MKLPHFLPHSFNCAVRFCLTFFVTLTSSSVFSQQAEIMVQTGHSTQVEELEFSPDSKVLVSGSRDGTIRLWDPAQAKEIRVFNVKGKFAFNKKGNLLAMTSIEEGFGPCKTIIYDLHQQKLIANLEDTDQQAQYVRGVDVTDKYLILKFFSEFTVYEIATGKRVGKTSPKTFYASNKIGVHPDGEQFAMGLNEGVLLFDVKIGRDKVISIPWTDKYNCLEHEITFSDDGKLMYTTGKGTKLTYDLTANQLINVETYPWSKKIWKTDRTGASVSEAVSPDGKWKAENDFEAMLFFEAATDQQIAPATTSPFMQAVLFHDEQNVMLTEGDDVVRAWDLSTGRYLPYLKHENWSTWGAGIQFSSDEKNLYSQAEDKIEIRNLETGKIIQKIKAPSVVFPMQGNGKYFAGGSLNAESMNKFVNGAPVPVKKFEYDDVWGHEYSPDGKSLATIFRVYTKKQINIYDAETGALKKAITSFDTIPGSTENAPSDPIRYSPNGKLIAFAQFRDITGLDYQPQVGVVDATTGKYLFNVDTGDDIWSIAFSKDASLIAAGNRNGDVNIIDVASRKLKTKLKGHASYITYLEFSDDNKLLFSTSHDSKEMIWDVEKGKHLITLVSFTNTDDYVFVTNDNYYLSSKGAFKGISFRIGDKLFPFEQFDLQYNRPDKVLEKLGRSDTLLIRAYKKAYDKRLKRMGFDESMFSSEFHLPTVKTNKTDIPLAVNQKTLTIKISATDSKFKLDRINVYVNDVSLYGKKGINLKSKSVQNADQDIVVELTPGRNKITVSVLNEKGVESNPEIIYVTYKSPFKKPDLYVLAIGVSDFDNDEYDLKYASKDANDLAALLQTKKDSIANVHVLKFIDKEATKENILQAKIKLKESKPEDKVIVFVASHGLVDDNLNYYIATPDVDFNNPSVRGLAYEDLEDMLDGIGARQKLLLIDACHSGEIDKEESVVVASNTTAAGPVKSRGFKTIKSKSALGLKNSFELMQELFSDISKGSGTVVISSASGNEFAFESAEWQNGVFTYSLLEGLKTGKADADKNKRVTISEIRDYVTNRVDKLTNGKQHPTSRKENLEFDFKVW